MARLLTDRRTVLLGLTAAALAPPAQAGVAVEAWPQTSALLARYVAERKLAGVVAVLHQQRSAPRVLSYGAQSLDGPPADARTLWRIFSMTKPITGVAAMKLIERRKLGLDQPVADFVPEFASLKVLDSGAERPARTVMRVRHLLTHTAGLGYVINEGSPLAPLYRAADLRPADPNRRAGEPKSLDEFGARLATLPLGSDPGTRYEYSVALDLLGLVIQRASGMSFEDYLRTALFEPTGMNDTGFMAKPEAASRLAMNYGVRASGIEPLEPAGRPSPYLSPPAYPSGGGGLLSTAHDYNRFCAMLMNDGMIDGVRVLAPSTARRTHANLLPRGVLADKVHFGAGMGIATLASSEGEPPGTYFWGGAAGTSMWMDPANGFSAVLMTQFMPSRAYPLWREFREAVYADFRNA